MAGGEYVSTKIEPTFIKFGDHVLVNLNTVKRIVLTKERVEFHYIDNTEQTFRVKDAMSFDQLIPNLVSYYHALDSVS